MERLRNEKQYLMNKVTMLQKDLDDKKAKQEIIYDDLEKYERVLSQKQQKLAQLDMEIKFCQDKLENQLVQMKQSTLMN